MGMDKSTIVRETTLDVIDGLRGAGGMPVAEEFGTVREVTALSGTDYTRADEELLPRDVATQSIGTQVKAVADEMGSVNYDLEWYAKAFKITRQERIALDAHIGDYTAEMAEVIFGHVMLGLDLDTQTILSSTTLNNEQAAGTVWSNITSSPIQNGHDAKVTYCPDADFALVGITNGLELMRHPDVKESLVSYEAAGSISQQVLEQTLAAMWMLSRGVRVLNRWYNSAAQGQTATLANAFGDFAFIGSSRALRLYKQVGSGVTETWEDPHTKTEFGSYDEMADPVRPVKSGGVYISGT